MLLAAAKAVRCIEGCGGESTSTITAIGLVLALVGVAIALMAWRSAAGALTIAREQHKEFLGQLRARADFEIGLVLEGHPSGLIETGQDEVRLRWSTKIENCGNRAATDVGINFLAPNDLRSLAWDQQDATKPSSTIERLKASNGTTHPAQYVVRLMERLSLRMVHINYASAVADTPKNPGEERIIPVMFRVWSADLPDEIKWRVVESEVTIRRTA